MKQLSPVNWGKKLPGWLEQLRSGEQSVWFRPWFAGIGRAYRCTSGFGVLDARTGEDKQDT